MLFVLLLICVLSIIAFTWFGVRKLEQQYPPVGNFLDIDGEQIHYTVSGSGPAMVLLHGASSSLYDFSSSIEPLLQQYYTVVCIDRPGLGHSSRRATPWPDPGAQAEVVHSVIRVLELDSPILVGHSWSGALVLRFLMKYPDVACKAILLAPASHPWPGGTALYNHISRWPLIGWLFRWLAVFPLGTLILNQGIKSIFYKGQTPPGFRTAAAIDLVLRPNSWKFNADDLVLLNQELKKHSPDYAKIEIPVLSITGEDDRIVSNAIHTDSLALQLRNFTTIQYSQTGHSPHQSNPRRVVADMMEFIENSN